VSKWLSSIGVLTTSSVLLSWLFAMAAYGVLVTEDSEDVTLDVYAVDSRSGLPKTDLVAGDIIASYHRTRSVRVAVNVSSVGVADAHSDGGWAEVDATNEAGVYRIDLPDAAVATGADFVIVALQATDTLIAPLRVQLIGVDFAKIATATALDVVDGVVDGIAAQTDLMKFHGRYILAGLEEVNSTGVTLLDFGCCVLPTVGTRVSTVPAATSVALVQHSSAPNVQWTITDAEGDPVDLSEATLELAVWDRTDTIIISDTTASGLSVGGDDDNIVTWNCTATHTVSTVDGYFMLWDVSDPYQALATGQFSIVHAKRKGVP